MSDNDVLGGPPNNTFDTPQKIVKKIIYAPTAASDMRYDSLAHIDYLMGGRKPDEDLMSLTSQNEYSYVSLTRNVDQTHFFNKTCYNLKFLKYFLSTPTFAVVFGRRSGMKSPRPRESDRCKKGCTRPHQY